MSHIENSENKNQQSYIITRQYKRYDNYKIELLLLGNTPLAEEIKILNAPLIIVETEIDIKYKTVYITNFQNLFTEYNSKLGMLAKSEEAYIMKKLGTFTLFYLLSTINDENVINRSASNKDIDGVNGNVYNTDDVNGNTNDKNVNKYMINGNANNKSVNNGQWQVNLYAFGHIDGKSIDGLYKFYHSLGLVFIPLYDGNNKHDYKFSANILDQHHCENYKIHNDVHDNKDNKENAKINNEDSGYEADDENNGKGKNMIGCFNQVLNSCKLLSTQCPLRGYDFNSRINVFPQLMINSILN